MVIYEYTHPAPHGVPHDADTNDGLGWCSEAVQCPYCAAVTVRGWPADAPLDTLDCPECGIRSAEPAPHQQLARRDLPPLT